ncbi:MAG: hypothetical protein EA001_07095 [Oscillatoriales cyanobacterium]|nr:MAG: hypothetical protein EA001_07095 [Oscillatoriales cyanobacterium]
MANSEMRELLPDEVINIKPGYYIQHPTCQIQELIQLFRSKSAHEIQALFSEEGLECQALQFGARSWEAGRLKIVLQFEPDSSNSDDSESTLDEIRRLAGS